MRIKGSLVVFVILFFVDQASAQLLFRRARQVDPCCRATDACTAYPPTDCCAPVDPCRRFSLRRNVSYGIQSPMFQMGSSGAMTAAPQMTMYDSTGQPYQQTYQTYQTYRTVRSETPEPSPDNSTVEYTVGNSGGLLDSISHSGAYGETRYQNNEVVIRAIEGFIQETISSNFGSDHKFTVYSIDSDATSSTFDAVNDAGDKWTVQVNVGGGEFSFSINRRDSEDSARGFTDQENTLFQDIAMDLISDLSQLSPLAPPIAKTWTNQNGIQVTGEVTALVGDMVQFKRVSDQKMFSVLLSIFSDEDQQLISNAFSENRLAAK